MKSVSLLNGRSRQERDAEPQQKPSQHGMRCEQEELALPAPAARLPEPSASERTTIVEATRRVRSRHRRVQVASVPAEGDMVRLRPPHSDTIGFTFEIRDSFGTTSGAFVETQMRAISRIAGVDGGKVDVDAINAVVALVDGVRPENEVEATLALQLGLSHHLACKMLGRMQGTTQLDHAERYGNLATKLQRTMLATAESLAKLRRGGEQGAAVGQVTVRNGGQAIVGPVTVHGRAGGDNGG